MEISRRTLKHVTLFITVVTALILTPISTVQGEQINIAGPSGSEAFGKVDAGAVFLYDGASAALISYFTGSTNDDQVGSGGVVVLSNGNFVVRSAGWDNGTATDAGAVTWGDGMSGITGAVSSANSLVGSSAADAVGEGGVMESSDDYYVVSSPMWDNGRRR